MRVGQPGMKGEQRHLDRKRNGERQKEPHLGLWRDVEAVQPEKIECVGTGGRTVEIGQAEDGDEHQHAPRHRVEHEFDGGVDTPVVAPDPDEEVHRDEHRIPEHVEQEQIERDEDPDHRRLESEHEEGELLYLPIDRAPGREQRDRRQESGEHYQQEADAVDAHEIVDAELRNPRVPLDKLKIGRGRIEAHPQSERHGKGRQRHAEREPADDAITAPVRVGDEQHDERPGKRHHPRQRQQHVDSQRPTLNVQLPTPRAQSPEPGAQGHPTPTIGSC